MDPLALAQLAPYQKIALDWPTVNDAGYHRCPECNQAIWRATDDRGLSYQWSDAEVLTLTVAHIRQRHPEVINGNN